MKYKLIAPDAKSKKSWKVGVVTSQFNTPITSKLEEGAIKKLVDLDFSESQVVRVQVPGAVEIPLAAKWLLESGCDGVIALGAVIRGETTHYDYVCSSVERGCTELMQMTGKPVVFGVLTTENRAQAEARTGGSKGHKGEEAVEVLVHMLSLKESIKN